jgi:tagatose-1,6-bisphosphate aldolase
MQWIDDIVKVCLEKDIPVFVNNIVKDGNITDNIEKEEYRKFPF